MTVDGATAPQRRSKRRILFFAEAVTLAHVARIAVLAGSLDPARFLVGVACHPAFDKFMRAGQWQKFPLASVDSAAFVDALSKGRPVYDAATLARYVEDDRAIIDAFDPDLIVGDFRLSLSVSARRPRGASRPVPYATVTNAYWSPTFDGPGFPMPVLPLTRMLPVPLAQLLFDIGRPFAMGGHCSPLNRVREANGLASLGSDLRRVYTDADHVLYADSPHLFPLPNAPANHHFLGPLLWAPASASGTGLWSDLPADRPLVYVTLGSSGAPATTAAVLRSLGSLPIHVIASMAGGIQPGALSPNIRVAPYVDGRAAAKRADLMVCNGGSLAVQQALAVGTPVVGVASNMDQFLNMGGVERLGAGRALRADRLGGNRLVDAVSQALDSTPMRQAAADAQRAFAAEDAPKAFVRWVDSILP